MAKPIAVQKLRHGKALCGKTFARFVETFNWVVDFCLSLQGDKDANNENGTISLDRSDPSAPVIRGTKAKGGGGDMKDRGCWRIEGGEWKDQYLMLGAPLVATSISADPSSYAGKFVAVQFSDTMSPAYASLVAYSTAAALATATADATKVTIPLGKVNSDGTGYDVDMRIMPHAGAFDVYVAPASSGSGSGGSSS